nr:MAG TPA: hypothetical protein [Caudoviricetes sp.]
MNSNQSAPACVNYAELEERVLRSWIPSVFMIAESQTARCRSSALTSLQNLPRGATPEHSERSLPLSEAITGRSALTVITDELYNQTARTVRASLNIKEEPTMTTPIKINANAISMTWTNSDYQGGDVWRVVGDRTLDALASELESYGFKGHTDPTTASLALHRMLRYSYVGAEVRLTSNHYGLNDTWLHTSELFSLGHNKSYAMLSEELRQLYFDNYEGLVNEGVDILKNTFGLKVHKDTIACALTLFERGITECTAGDMRISDDGVKPHVTRYSLVHLLMNLNGVFANRGATLIGEGFKDGNPMVVLAKPVFRDGVFQELQLQEQRTGRFLQSIYGTSYDFREAIDDLKVYNAEPQSYLCVTEQEWFDAYAHGPSSCMKGFDFRDSPVRCYATTSHGLPDNNLRLCINYTGELFGDNFKVINRAIVNIETQCYVRAYGDNSDAVMRAIGYIRDSGATDGCMLAKIEHPHHEGAYLMPYLDGDQDYVDDEGDCWRITDSGDFGATEPDGYIHTTPRCCCNHCDAYMDEDDAIETAEDGLICEYCRDSYYVTPVGREELYNRNECTWSEYENGYVHEQDAFECPVYGWVYDGNTRRVFEDIQVHDDATEYNDRVGDYILTESAAIELDCVYMGREEDEEDAEDEQEEAA